jgi:hypothetical protein
MKPSRFGATAQNLNNQYRAGILLHFLFRAIG